MIIVESRNMKRVIMPEEWCKIDIMKTRTAIAGDHDA